MKTLILMALFVLVSCGEKENSDPYLFEVSNFNRQWTTSMVIGYNNQIEFDSIDLSDASNITVYGLERDGVKADCVYSGVHRPYNDFYGKVELTYISGDTFVCSQLSNGFGYEAANDTRKGYEYMKIGGLELR